MTIARLRPGWVPMDHPVFEVPPDEAPLWRYMDLTRFIALLERRALFFSALRDLSDRFEGSMTPDLLEYAHAQPGLWHGMEMTRLMTYVNCWNEDTAESVALWSVYASQAGGVAIRSSFASIRAALPEPDPMSASSPGVPLDGIYIGRVHYVDYRTHMMPTGNAWWPVVHKRRPYAFEREVRLVIQPFDLNQEVAATTNARIAEMEKAPLPDASNELIRDVAREIAPAGYDVVIDPSILIEEVIVAPQAPDWLLDLTRDVTRRYGVDVPVRRSDLDALSS